MPALPPDRRLTSRAWGRAAIELHYYLNVPPTEAWTALVADESAGRLYPELSLGPAEPAWPAAGATRLARLSIGLLREPVLLESLEARPGVTFRFRLVGLDIRGEIGWALEPLAGGTRVVHAATIDPIDRWASALARLSRRSPGERAEQHLRALKAILDAAAPDRVR